MGISFLKNLIKPKSRYMVKVDGDVVHLSSNLKKATYMYELEVKFNDIFTLPYRHTICLMERCDDGWKYLRVKDYDKTKMRN